MGIGHRPKGSWTTSGTKTPVSSPARCSRASLRAVREDRLGRPSNPRPIIARKGGPPISPQEHDVLVAPHSDLLLLVVPLTLSHTAASATPLLSGKLARVRGNFDRRNRAA